MRSRRRIRSGTSGMKSPGTKLSARRIVAMTGDAKERDWLRTFQDEKCVEGGCYGTPVYKLEEKMEHGWTTMECLCVEHAEERSSRFGLPRL